MPTSTAEATWDGTLKEGSGHLALGSGVWEGPYTFASRFEGGDETNPEELIGAAEAGCFSMALALGLEEAGYAPERIHTEASVHLDADALEIDRIDLRVEGEVPDADADAFREQAAEAKENCPVSKALAGPAIDLTAELL
ncbi:OsmC family peroxiredoxin [Salinirarus marinus]|uniref:OsmC family peroxiredoxin n=1 Tax=Salinirarus marinus TaxID=3068310 RepID=UPI003C6C59F9